MPTTQPMPERHPVPDREGVYVFQQARSKYYYAEVCLDGRKVRKSMHTDRLPTAFKLAIDWHKQLLKAARVTGPRLDRLATDPTMAEVYDSWRLTLTPAKRAYAAMKWSTIEPFWRLVEVSDVTTGTFRAFFKWRRSRKTPQGTVPKNHTIHKDLMVLRQILRFAIEEGHLTALPILPKVGRIETNPRPWFSRDEWTHLIDTSNRRVKEAQSNPRVHQQRQDLEHFLLFMLDSMMRVSEVRNLTVGQCRRIIPAADMQPEYLVIQLRGKTGHRTVVAGGFAPLVYTDRAAGKRPGDRLWPCGQRDAFRELLVAANLRADEFGNTRNLKSIRATAISFRILAQAPTPNLLLIARNAGTSVAMIDQFYAKRLSAEMGAEQLITTVSVP